MLVVGDDDGGFLRAAKGVHTVGHNLQGIHVEAGVGLVEYAEERVEHGHLEYLVALFLASAETDIHLALGKLSLHSHESHLVFQEFQELACAEF